MPLREVQAELALYRTIFDLSMVGAAHLDNKGNVLWSNAAYAGILGYEPNEVVGLNVLTITHPDDAEASRQRILDLFSGAVLNSSVDRRYLHKSGHYVWVNISAALLPAAKGEPARVVGLLHDVSARKVHEIRLRESEERLNSILDTVQDVVWSFSPEQSRLVYMNAAATRNIYHRSHEEFYRDPELWLNVVHPEDRRVVKRIWERLSVSGTSEDLYRIVRPNGEIRWLHARAWASLGADRKPQRFEGIVRDVTEIKAAQIALEASESRLRQVMNTGRIGIWEMNSRTFEVRWSPVFKEICGFAPDFPPSFEAFSAIYHPEDSARMVEDHLDLVAGRRTEFAPFRIIRPDGSIRWLQSIGSIREESDGTDTWQIGTVIDVTKIREAELIIEAQRAKMTSASKMSALGEMAGGLAHEINNPVAIIHGNAALLRQLALSGEMDATLMAHTAEVIETTATRIAKITRSLRAFARDGDQDPFERVKLKAVVEETVEFCRERFLGHGINFIIEPIDPALELRCRPVQISQVLLNLLNNAHDAVEKGKASWIRVAVIGTYEQVELSVTDSGSGIAPDLRDKIFQPFFTTKEVGRGTGLGLSVAKGIVESHEGTLLVDTQSPNTRFVMKLPRRTY
jgi:PAS domain S-box-containing protein